MHLINYAQCNLWANRDLGDSTKRIKASRKTWPRGSSPFRLYMVFVPICQIVKYSVCTQTLLFPCTSFQHSLLPHTDVLQKRPTTPTLKAHTITYLRTHTKSFEYTLGVIRTLEQQTRDEIRRLGGNVSLEKIVDGLHVDERWPKTSIMKWIAFLHVSLHQCIYIVMRSK